MNLFNRLFKGWLGALLLMLSMAVAGLGTAGAAGIMPHPAPAATVQAKGTISVRELPPEAIHVINLIVKGGPFKYRQDGRTFSNREHVLPRKPYGYYTEYTVITPGAPTRGARRIVAGAGREKNPATSGEYWYTNDHYKTFRRVVK